MAPSIRVDEEVYAWLQQHARPFEDTPNLVLRRLAGMDQKTEEVLPEKAKAAARVGRTRGRLGLTGRQLNREWGVNAHHALFHRDGTWYNNLEKFPGALFDPEGYVLFKTEEEYLRSPYVNVGQETNVPGGISSIPGYVRKR